MTCPLETVGWSALVCKVLHHTKAQPARSKNVCAVVCADVGRVMGGVVVQVLCEGHVEVCVCGVKFLRKGGT